MLAGWTRPKERLAGASLLGQPRPVAEPVIKRDEVVGVLFALYDMLEELRRIRRALEDDGEAEEDLGE
jgi:hypothetical protein